MKSEKYQQKFWLTPPNFFADLNKIFDFNFDPCPFPRALGYDCLTTNWQSSNWLNPPFYPSSPEFYKPVEFLQKAIDENLKFNSTVIILPTHHYVNKLLFAGARIFPIPRIKFLETTSGIPQLKPGSTSLFILGHKNLSSTFIKKSLSNARIK